MDIVNEAAPPAVMELRESGRQVTPNRSPISVMYLFSLVLLALSAYLHPLYIEYWPVYSLMVALFALAGSILYLVFMYNVWSHINSIWTEHPETIEPKEAILYLFIPLFNYYWYYQVVMRSVRIVNQGNPAPLHLAVPVTMVATGYLLSFISSVYFLVYDRLDFKVESIQYLNEAVLVSSFIMLNIYTISGAIYMESIRRRINSLVEVSHSS